MNQRFATIKNTPSLNDVIACFLFLSLSCALIGCGPSFLRKQDYQASLGELSRGSVKAALAVFPKGEKDTFITSMEKGYLNLLLRKPEMEPLKKYSLIFENRLRYKVTRELKSFFYAETPEEYYASEHEIVWLHLLLSWGYSIDGDFEKACVETRQSAHLLSYTWSEEGHFDDPMLRTFLAALWTMCGSWEDAVVDLRAAYVLDNSLKWARELSGRDVPPRYLFIVFGGTGPEVAWDAGLNELNPLRGMRQVQFNFGGLKSDLSISDVAGKTVDLHRTPDASMWYERHLRRDNEIHDLIMDSRYGNRLVSGTGEGTGKILAGTAAGLGIGAVSLGIGGGLVYLGGVAGSSELAGLGIGIGAAGVIYGYKVAKRTYRDSMLDMKKGLDPSRRYRFVRFLPEYLWIGWSDDELIFPLRVSGGRSDLELGSPTLNNGTSIFLLYLPDVSAPERSRHEWLNALETAIGNTQWDFFDRVGYDIHQRGDPVLFATSPAGNDYEIVNLFDAGMIKIILKRGILQKDQILVIDIARRSVISPSKSISLFLDERPEKFLSLIENTIRSELFNER